MNRYDTETKHGTLSTEVEIVSTDRVDDYDTLDFTITVQLPYGFKEHDVRTQFKGDRIIITVLTEHEVTPDD